MENIIEIYWYDLSKEKQQELLDAGFVNQKGVDGFDNQNVVDGSFPLTYIFIDLEEEEKL